MAGDGVAIKGQFSLGGRTDPEKRHPVKTPTYRRLSTIAAAALLAAALQGTAAQAASDSPSAGAPVPTGAVVAQTLSAPAAGQDSPQSYWTAERMQAARDGSEIVAKAPARAARSPQLQPSKPTAVKPTAVQPTAGQRATAQNPVPHIGKVFFTMGGVDYVCSANAVTAANKNTIATAGHCTKDLNGGAYATNFVFAPAYNNGAAPYGLWSGRKILTTEGWASKGDINFDTSFVVLSPLNRRNLSDVVGASGVTFNEDQGLSYTAYGYPASAPYNGKKLYACGGTATADVWGNTDSQGIPCTMNGGSSGGPWFVGSGANGYQNSVNSFGYNAVPSTMFGPYWGDEIEAAYDSASAS